MSLASAKKNGLLSISSTISATASSNPPKTSIVVLQPKSAMLLFMKIKPDIISTERLGWSDTVYMPTSEKSISFSVYEGVMERIMNVKRVSMGNFIFCI